MIFINAIAPQTPCFISNTGDRFINFTSLTVPNWPHYEIVDITPATSYSHNWLYVGAKGEQYTINFVSRFPDPATAHAWMKSVAESTGLIYTVYNNWGLAWPNQILKQVRYTDHKVFLAGSTTTFCSGNGVEIRGDLSMFPQP